MKMNMQTRTATEVPMYSKLIGALCAHEEQRAAQLNAQKRRRVSSTSRDRLTNFAFTSISAASPTTEFVELESISDSDESISSEEVVWSCLESGDDNNFCRSHLKRNTTTAKAKPGIPHLCRKRRRRCSTSSSSSISIGNNSYFISKQSLLPTLNDVTIPANSFSSTTDSLSFMRNTYISPSLKPQIPAWGQKTLAPLSAQSEALVSLLEMANVERERLRYAPEMEAVSRPNIFIPNEGLSSTQNGLQMPVLPAIDAFVTCSSSSITNSISGVEPQIRIQSEKNLVKPTVPSPVVSTTAVTIARAPEVSKLSIAAMPVTSSRPPVALPLVANVNTIRPANVVGSVPSTAIPATTVCATPATVLPTPSSSTEAAVPASVLSTQETPSNGIATSAMPAIAISSNSNTEHLNTNNKCKKRRFKAKGSSSTC
jgi:hypothetical protein